MSDLIERLLAMKPCMGPDGHPRLGPPVPRNPDGQEAAYHIATLEAERKNLVKALVRARNVLHCNDRHYHAEDIDRALAAARQTGEGA
jgi:hypothetical protein